MQLTFEQPRGLGALTPCTVEDLCMTFDSLKTELSFSVPGGLVRDPSVNTEVHGWSNPFYKVA